MAYWAGFISSGDPSTPYVVMGIGLMILMYLMLRTKLRNRKKDPLARAPGAPGLSLQRDFERQMNDLLVELAEMARQISAQLDTRAARLETLIREADEKIARLEQSSASRPSAPVHPSVPTDYMRLATSGETPAEPPPDPYSPDPRHGEIYALADQGQKTDAIAARLGRPKGEVELILALRPRGS